MLPVVHPVPAFADNYIWLMELGGGRALVVDPGEAEGVLDRARSLGLEITDIWATHWHPDHVAGIPRLKQATGARAIGPAAEADRIQGLDATVSPGDRLAAGPFEAEVLGVGAHTAGHIAFYLPRARAAFVGDTLFAMGCGRLFEGSAADMFEALGRLMALPDETRLFAGHEYTLANARFALSIEPDNAALVARAREVHLLAERGVPTLPTTVAAEKATNPFVRAGDPAELGRRREAKDAA